VSAVARYFRDLIRDAVAGWDRFWFTPIDPATLGLVRLLAGALLLYTHAIWTLDLEAFFGNHSWTTREAAESLAARPPAADATASSAPVHETDANDTADDLPMTPALWSHLWWIPPDAPRARFASHVAALLVFTLLMLGCCSRVMAALAWLLVISYIHRARATEFGLDHVNGMLAMYLWIGPCGGAFSLDRVWRRWRAGWHRGWPAVVPSVGANISLRLLQLHLCVVYFFSAIGKLQGVYWWNGQALWYVLADPEYRSFDVEWLARWPVLVAVLTAIVVYWELSFCFLVWPSRLRPLVLAVAVPLHLGIAFGMRIAPFGLGMLIACLSFVPSWVVRRALGDASQTAADAPTLATAPPDPPPAATARDVRRAK
jgi:hypothetical protein